jgi:transcriptional regulator with XRE-family HTH domain
MYLETKTNAWVESRRLNWDLLMASLRENFARNLSLLLRNHKRKPIELARALNVNPSTVTGWTTGRITPQIERLDAIADFFGVTYVDLLADKHPPSPKQRDIDSILGDLASARGYRLVPKS